MLPVTGKRATGVTWLLISALAYSTAGLFTKAVSADAYTIIWWRAVFAAALLAAYVRWRHGKASGMPFVGMGIPGWSVALAISAGTAAFIPAFKHTTVANVALIYAAVPFAAAAIAWLWMREVPATRTILASMAAAGGVGVIVGDSLESPNLTGDLLAVWMTVMMGTIFAIYRRYPETPTTRPIVASSLMLAAIAPAVTDVFDIPPTEIPLMLGFGLVHAVAFVSLAEGARYLPAADAGLLSALETPLALVWAWLLLQERPSAATILGGVMVLGAVLWVARNDPRR